MNNFRIKSLVVGQMGTNCYVTYQEGNKAAIIIDPGDESSVIIRKCQELGIEPEAVLLTHGHFDHIMALGGVRQAYPGVCVYVSEMEEKLLGDPQLNLSAVFGCMMSGKADRMVKDGDELTLAGIQFRVIDTPGHTSGSVCYYIENEGVLISGDTLFEESLGRTDFPTGSAMDIIASICDKLLLLPEETIVYPGHGCATTIGHEREHNPALSYRSGKQTEDGRI